MSGSEIACSRILCYINVVLGTSIVKLKLQQERTRLILKKVRVLPTVAVFHFTAISNSCLIFFLI